MGAWGATAGNVKRLLPPRQSRGISFVSLGAFASLIFSITMVADSILQFEPATEKQRRHDNYQRRFRLSCVLQP